MIHTIGIDENREILECVAKGLEIKEISRCVGISRSAVYQRMFRMYKKYKVKNRIQLAVAFVLGKLDIKPGAFQ